MNCIDICDIILSEIFHRIERSFYMLTFIIGLVILAVGAAVYGRVCEREKTA